MSDNALPSMSPLLPALYPQHDLFICDIADAIPKDMLVEMEHPFFSLSTRPDTSVRQYEHNGNKIIIYPNVVGMPTIFDKDVLIFCISQVMAAIKEGRPVSKTVKINSYDLLRFANRGTDGRSYQRLVQAIMRLRGVNIRTNIRTGDIEQTNIFGLIDEAEVQRKYGMDGRLVSCEIVLSDWVMNAILSKEVLTLHRDYFRLRKPLERRVYEIARKHCGRQPVWEIGLPLLYKKSGSGGTLRRFRHSIRAMGKTNHLPDYELEHDDQRDVVSFFNRGGLRPKAKNPEGHWNGTLSPNIYEVARAVAPGWDVHYLEQQWRSWVAEKDISPRNADAHFVKFCSTWAGSRPAP